MSKQIDYAKMLQEVIWFNWKNWNVKFRFWVIHDVCTGIWYRIHRDPGVVTPKSRTHSSLSSKLLPTPSESFKLPHQGGKLTEMTYLVAMKYNGRQGLRFSPREQFSVHFEKIVFFWHFLVIFSKKKFFFKISKKWKFWFFIGIIAFYVPQPDP